jgi:hypothetical protein
VVVLRFIGSTPGRVARVVAGLGLIEGGVVAGGWWLALAAVGLVPLMAGLFDVCVLGPLFRLPFGGRAFRASQGCR